MTEAGPKIFLVAAEPSGDQLGAALALELQSQNPDVTLSGIGGGAMFSAGVQSDFDISPLAILGFTEALKAYPVVRQKVRAAADLIMASSPDAVVLIDSWGFMIRVAAALHKLKFSGQIIKYVAPQVWAMREGRAKILAKYVDHVLSIHRFDAPYFEKEGLSVTFVGNPMFDDKFVPSSKKAFRKSRKIPDKNLILAVLFGSRPSEIERLFEPFADSLAAITSRYPEIAIFSPVTQNVANMIEARVDADPRLSNLKLLPESDKYELFNSADIALACSGTVTTQLAMMGVPAVVAYKLSPITAVIAWFLFKPDHISLINISAGEELMPEFVQWQCKPGALTKALTRFIEDESLRARTSARLIAQASVMKGKGGPASRRAASAIFEILASN